MKNLIKKLLKENLKENVHTIYNVPVDFLWNYKEFDRCNERIWGDEYIKKLSDDIKSNGIKAPVQLKISSGKALLVEGNHRLCIAKYLDIKTIPTIVVFGSFGSINQHLAKPIDFNSKRWERGLFY